jgi:RimJ/RimL family protein N-acetyltransferase
MLASERLLLRPYTSDDLPDLIALLGDEEGMATMGGPFDTDGATAWLQRNLARYRSDGFGRYSIRLRDTDTYVGDCGLVSTQVEATRQLELGWIVDRSMRSRGIATEAAAAWRDHALSTLGVKRFISMIDEPNIASRRVAQNIGMRIERRAVWTDGHPYLMYSISDVSIS